MYEESSMGRGGEMWQFCGYVALGVDEVDVGGMRQCGYRRRVEVDRVVVRYSLTLRAGAFVPYATV